MAEAPLPDDPGTVGAGVVQGGARAARAGERSRSWPISSAQLEDVVEFDGRRVLYQWIGGTRSDWRGQGHFRALTEEQEVWAMANGFDEIIVKTKNRFYEMRSTLAQLDSTSSGSCRTRRDPASRRCSSASASASTCSTRTAAAARSRANPT